MKNYFIFSVAGQSGPSNLWRNQSDRPFDHCQVLEAQGSTPQEAMNSLLTEAVDWEVQKVYKGLIDDRAVYLHSPKHGDMFMLLVEVVNATQVVLGSPSC